MNTATAKPRTEDRKGEKERRIKEYRDVPPEDRTREKQAINEGLDKLPYIACLCVTFCRPRLLENLIASFEALDYPLSKRCLIILDDAGQYPGEPSGPGWEIISVKKRFHTLSDKRNALAAMCPREVDAIAFWDDDDTFLPWTLHGHAYALEGSSVSHPSLVMTEDKDGVLKVVKTGSMYQATQCIDLDLFETVGGYPHGNSGVDQKLMALLKDRAGVSTDPCIWYPPSFVYGWHTGLPHLSSGGLDGYESEKYNAMLEERAQESFLTPKWRRKWNTEVRNFLGMDLMLDTHRMPAWWQTTELYIQHITPPEI